MFKTIALLLLIPSICLGQNQVCYNPVSDPITMCNGQAGNGRPVWLPVWAGYPATNPVQITRVILTAQGAPFPAGADGLVSVSVDPGHQYLASGWPAHQELPGQADLASHLIPLGQMDFRQGQPRFAQFAFNPPVPYYWGDAIIVDTPCSGGFATQLITTICWIKN